MTLRTSTLVPGLPLPRALFLKSILNGIEGGSSAVSSSNALAADGAFGTAESGRERVGESDRDEDERDALHLWILSQTAFSPLAVLCCSLCWSFVLLILDTFVFD